MKEYEELIAALRYCAEHEGCDYYIAKDCPRESTWVCGVILMLDASDALEAAEKKIAKLEAQMPKEGEWIEEDGMEGAIKGRVFCSNCKNLFQSIVMTNEKIILTNQKTKYCPNCGAKMRYENQTDNV